jgi:hypothetical protein
MPHLDDLKNSPENYRDEDLSLIGNYVKDNFFMHDHISEKRTMPYLATPKQAFENNDYAAC